MGFAVFANGKRFGEISFKGKEDELEKVIKTNSKLLFGPKSIYIDLKNKVESEQLGDTIPDGFLFDISDNTDPQFYLVEVELQEHDFYRHIFRQITKFFAFYKSSASRTKLTERLHRYVMNNPSTKREFQQLLPKSELYKSLRDIIENSRNILLIADNVIDEAKEVQETYTDTWGKFVKSAVLKVYVSGGQQVLVLNPGFEEVKELEATSMSEETEETQREVYNEEYHLEDVKPELIQVYRKIKSHMTSLNLDIMFNPQHYYISIRRKRNFAFIKMRRNKIKIVIMLPYEVGTSEIKNHTVRQLTQPVQNFYNGPCFEVQIESEKDLQEVLNVLDKAYAEMTGPN